MAVGNVKRLAGPFTGAGTKILPFGFKIFEPTDVFVALAEKENDPPKNLEYNADYSVEMNQDQEATPGGTVTLTNALNETQIVSVGTDIPYTQEVQLTNHNRFPPEIVNMGLDRVVIQIQQLVEQVRRAITTDPTDTRTPEQLLSDIFNTEKNAGVSAAAASNSAAEAKTSADTAQKYSDAVTSFKDQIVATGNNIAAVKTNAENIEDIKTAAKNVAAIKTNANNIVSIKVNADNMDAILDVRNERENIVTVAGHLPDIHAIGEEARQSQESAKKSAEAAATSEAAAKVSQDNAFVYRGEAAVARNEAQKIAEGVAALDGSGVAQATLDLMKHLGASEVDTDEYLRAFVDAEGRLLWWVDREGNIGWSKGIPGPIQKVLTALQELTAADHEALSTVLVPDNPEWLKLWQDKEGKVLAGIRADGTFEFFKGIPKPVAEALDALTTATTTNAEGVASLKEKTTDLDNRLATEIDEDNPEWLRVVRDADGKVLYGVKTDGSFENSKGVPTPTATAIAKIDGKAEKNAAAIEDANGRLSTEETDNPEWLKVWQDKDGKVLAGIRTDGTFEFFKGAVQNFLWSDDNLTDLEKLLTARGFKTPMPVDWSDAASMQIPEPRCAVINIVSSHNSMPTSRASNHHDWMEFWDMQGNYFKKRIINNAQGRSSMSYVKKNFAFDLCNDEWVGDDTFSIRFGDWVPQDSFHAKAYYTDYFRGVAVVSYQLMNEVLLTRGIEKDRPWKKGLKVADNWGAIPESFASGGDNSLELDTGARCFPDGFPVIVHFNGEFYGIFSWQLKKSRENMHMGKTIAEHIHLDGIIGVTTFFNVKGTDDFAIQWDQFEIRNPKKLYCMDGSKYEADVNQKELIDETSQFYDPDNKDHVRSAKVKAYINRLSLSMHELNDTRDKNYSGAHSATGAEAVRNAFEKYFDADNWIDYLCLSDVVKNADGFGQNWQWATYDGRRWFVNLYDVDMSFGGDYRGGRITAPLTNHINRVRDYPTGFIVEFYSSKGDYGTGELEKRYAELRKAGIFTSEHIINLLRNWTLRIGIDAYDAEFGKWSDSPCHGRNEVNSDYWELILDSQGLPIAAEASDYDKTKTYTAGEECAYGVSKEMGFFKFRALRESLAQSPVSKFKYYDSLYRVKSWLDTEISNMDLVYNYQETKE